MKDTKIRRLLLQQKKIPLMRVRTIFCPKNKVFH